MLPSNPSVRRRGRLPITPSVQSRSFSRSRVDDDDSQSRPSIHHRFHTRPGLSPDSTDSTSSNEPVSSLFSGRHRERSPASSNTSLEDHTKRSHLSSRSEAARVVQDQTPPVEVNHGEDTGNYASSFGNYIASAAKNLTINATKAWSAHINIDAGEETPPGHDSRLTRAMKTYHLEKARDPTDLPVWLFGKPDRRVRLETTQGSLQVSDHAFQAEASGPHPPHAHVHVNRRHPAPSVNDHGTSKATERLKAMYAAKRNAHARTASPNHLDSHGAVNGGESGKSGEAPAKQRVGLPSGPRQKMVFGR